MATSLEEELRALVGPENVRPSESIARYTTWRVGGSASLLVLVHDAEQLCRAVELGRRRMCPVVVLGRGSNVLVSDAGVDGLVIVNRAAELSIDGMVVHAESGVLLSVLARRTVEAGLRGLEWSHDIPGSVGGAVVNNAGANGSCVADVLISCCVLSATGLDQEVGRDALLFKYRESRFRREAEEAPETAPRPVLLSATFCLQPDEDGAARERLVAARARRKATQPAGTSAGSTFKNPEGDYAGRLIEAVGLKGARCGGATISTVHANFIGTETGASSEDIRDLLRRARRRVYEEYGVVLETEVQYILPDGRIGSPLE